MLEGLGPSPFFRVEGLNLAATGLRTFSLVQDVSYQLDRGEALALVGESGCGKSLTCWSSLGLPPHGISLSVKHMSLGDETLADTEGLNQKTFRRIRGKRIAMIFQDPVAALNPVRRVGSYLTSLLKANRGMGGEAATAEAIRLLDAVGIPRAKERLVSYPHELSSGQCQRVMIAGALSGEPDIIIADEPTTALDVTTQAQIMSLLKDLRKDRGLGLLIVSHDLGVIAENVDRVAVMYAGRIVEMGDVDAVLSLPQHPYTLGLLNSVPPEAGRAALTPVGGNVPSLFDLPDGCAFWPRCGSATDAPCKATVPDLKLQDGRSVACWHPVARVNA